MGKVTTRIAMIGVGNEFRRDDGVRPAVVRRLQNRAAERPFPPGTVPVKCDGDPGRLIAVWEGAGLAVVVDAAYPFISCAHCGPCATVIDGLPYDRECTTVRAFDLCLRCVAEYADPGDRRFHAEPLACPVCGPRVVWQVGNRRAPVTGQEALRRAVAAIASGRTVAVKGLGGYQLVCDAQDTTAVGELHRHKRRHAKPFAVMLRDLPMAARLVRLGRAQGASPATPVVLLRAHGARASAARRIPRLWRAAPRFAFEEAVTCGARRCVLHVWTCPRRPSGAPGQPSEGSRLRRTLR